MAIYKEVDMREIKFRFWDKKDKKWADDYHICIWMSKPYTLEAGATVWDDGFTYNPLEIEMDGIGVPPSNDNIIASTDNKVNELF